MAEIATIEHDLDGIAGEFDDRAHRIITCTDDRVCTSTLDCFQRLAHAAEHERELPRAGLRVVGDHRAGDNEGHVVIVGDLDRALQGRVVLGTHRRLHPVQHVPAAVVCVRAVEHSTAFGLDLRGRHGREIPPTSAIETPIRPFDQNPSRSPTVVSSSSIGTRTCSVVSRSRTVTALSSSESKSTVTASGVPISSWRR